MVHSLGTRKERPASRVFLFLPAFGRCRPSVSAPAPKMFAQKSLALDLLHALLVSAASHHVRIRCHAHAWLELRSIYVDIHMGPYDVAPTKHCIRCMHCPSDCLASLCLPTDRQTIESATVRSPAKGPLTGKTVQQRRLTNLAIGKV